MLARPPVALGLTALVLIGLLGVLGMSLFGAYRAAEGEVERIEPRYARLAGLVASAQELDRALAELTESAARMSYSSSVDLAAAGAQMQQDLRQAAEQAGASVAGSQVLSSGPSAKPDRISVMLRLDTGLEALRQLLLALERESPRVFVESLSVQPTRVRQKGAEGDSLSVQLVIAARRLPR